MTDFDRGILIIFRCMAPTGRFILVTPPGVRVLMGEEGEEAEVEFDDDDSQPLATGALPVFVTVSQVRRCRRLPPVVLPGCAYATTTVSAVCFVCCMRCRAVSCTNDLVISHGAAFPWLAGRQSLHCGLLS